MNSLKEKLQNLTVAEAVSYGVSVLGAIVGAMAIISTAVKTGAYNDKIFSMEAQRNQLRGTLSQSLSQQTEETNLDENGEETVDDSQKKGSAQQSGVAVANYMNRYIPITLDNPNAGTSDLDKRASLDEMLYPLFAESDKGAATSWYDPAHNYQSGTSNNFSWSFECAYSYKGESLPVLWLCRNNRADNAVVAYATAVYDTETGLFSGVSRHITKEGAERAVGYVSGESYGVISGTDSGDELDTGVSESLTVSGNGVDNGLTGDEVEDDPEVLTDDFDESLLEDDSSDSSSMWEDTGSEGDSDSDEVTGDSDSDEVTGDVPGTNSGSDTGTYLPESFNEEELGLPPGFFAD